ncbi:unnamed protein product [Cyprideis torosa]|uniref:Uncharacterized protein n=1 Tax=Cyprideis torosa TaxID=163714 RepID=A0A7R8WCJ0_9CRUS|nr:unnamed protein product [Cyprideis torosa]CAG0888038.1 unnamed protein product [Cyprideis torosa]
MDSTVSRRLLWMIAILAFIFCASYAIFSRRCLDMTTENSSEQVQVLRLFHYLFCLAPKDFPPTLVRSLASIAQFGCGNSEIKAHHVALAILGEIAIFNASLAQRTGVFPLLLHNAVDLQDQRGAEALLSIILHARNMPSLRNMVGNLHLSSVLAPLTDTTYKHYYIDSERQEERSRRLLCSRSAVLSCLRSWPGLFELAFMEDHREPPFRNVIRVLGSEKDENVDVVLDLLFSLFDLPRPPDPPPPSTFKSRRTSAFDKAPRSPSVSSAPPPPQDHPFEEVLSKVTNRTAYDSTWRLHDGFTVAEGLRVLPPLRRDRPDLVLSYLALLLCYLISENVFHLLTEVILNRSQRLGVKATLLLGELLHLAAMLPSPTPSRDALPLLVSTAGATGTSERSVRAKEAVKHLLLVEDVITRCFDVSLLKPNSFYLRQLLWFHHHGHGTPEEARKEEEPKPSPRKSRGSWSSSGSSKRRRRNTNDFKSLLKRPFEEREGPTASSPPSAIPKGLQFQLNAPVDSWDWNIVRNVIRDPSAILCEEAVVPGSPSAQFVKTLVHFYAPSSELYSVMQQSSPHAEAATELGVLLFDFLLKIAETDEAPYLDALLEDIHGAIVIMVSDAPSPSCLLAPGKLSSTLAHHYFLFVGRLTQSRKGMDILERNRIIQVLRDLLATTAHDTYFKLIISSVNYSFPGITRTLLSGALTSDKEASRIFATEFLCVLARVGVPDFPSWGLELCVFQLYDPSDVVVKAAVGVLEELCEQEAYVDALVSLRPSLLHLGDAGVNLLTRCCGVPSGFQFLRDSGFLSHHLMDWRDKYHLRYVQIVHDGIANVLTRHQRDETGRYGRRTNVPPRLVPYSAPWHLHSELSRHPEGLAFLLEREGDWMTQMWSILLSPNVGSDENNLVKIKAAIWSLAHFASPQPENGGDPQGTEGEVGARQNFGRDLLSAVFEIVRSADISSLRGTAFYAISLISVTVTGAELARQKGWVATASRLHLATLNLSDASFSLSPSSPVTPENVHRLKGPAADQSEHPSSEEDHAQSR